MPYFLYCKFFNTSFRKEKNQGRKKKDWHRTALFPLIRLIIPPKKYKVAQKRIFYTFTPPYTR